MFGNYSSIQIDLINLRDQALFKLSQGKIKVNEAQNIEEFKEGYDTFVSGIEEMISYSKQEKNQILVQQIKEMLKEKFTEAEQMKKNLQEQEKIQGQKVVFQEKDPQKKEKEKEKKKEKENKSFFGGIFKGKQQMECEDQFPKDQKENKDKKNPKQQIIDQGHQKQPQEFASKPVPQQQIQHFSKANVNILNGKQNNLHQAKAAQVYQPFDKQKLISQNKELQEFSKQLLDTIVVEKPDISWDEISGLETAKDLLQEAVILPIKFPNFFGGIRKPWKGILLYGPPGTGKTLLAKACAKECEAVFFSISAADLTSKWVGESEKLIKALFLMARSCKPSIIFLDEVDSLAGDREKSNASESSQRMKTQFLTEMQGVGNQDQGILVLGATNLPWSLDPAIRRRFEKRIFINLPDLLSRKNIFLDTLSKEKEHNLNEKDIQKLAEKTDGYSGADISILIRDAAYEPLRKCQRAKKFKLVNSKWTPCDDKDPKGKEMKLITLQQEEVQLPNITLEDFLLVLSKSKPSVDKNDLQKYYEFTSKFGQEN